MDKQEVIKKEFAFVFGDEKGKRVLSRILDFCGLLNATWTPEDGPYDLAQREGMRKVGMYVLGMAQAVEMDRIIESMQVIAEDNFLE